MLVKQKEILLKVLQNTKVLLQCIPKKKIGFMILDNEKQQDFLPLGVSSIGSGVNSGVTKQYF